MGNKTVINGNKEVENFRKIKKQEKRGNFTNDEINP